MPTKHSHLKAAAGIEQPYAKSQTSLNYNDVDGHIIIVRAGGRYSGRKKRRA